MNFELRPYADSDIESLTDFMNENHELDTFSKSLLLEKLSGDPYWDSDKALICHDGNKVLGFMMGVVREIRNEKIGYIKLMAVHRDTRKQGIATLLYEELERSFIVEGVRNVRIYDAPLNYLMPGVDPKYTGAVCFALRRGFRRIGDALNMSVELKGSDWQTDQEEQNFANEIEIYRPDIGELEEVIDFVKLDWELWEHEVRMAFADEIPSVHIARKDGVVKAFSVHNGNNKGTGWFGPMGTHPDLRGLGIGSVLLKRCLKDMKAAGHQTATIPWVDPIAFYAHHVGAQIDRVFWRFGKELSH